LFCSFRLDFFIEALWIRVLLILARGGIAIDSSERECEAQNRRRPTRTIRIGRQCPAAQPLCREYDLKIEKPANRDVESIAGFVAKGATLQRVEWF
jgi:hypothetical protein